MIRCLEYLIETAGTIYAGLAPAGVVSPTQFPGEVADSYGYEDDGDVWTGNVDSGTYSALNGDDVLGILLDDDGNIWFAVNGTVVAGDPEAGTGATFTHAGDPLLPCAYVADGARVRLLTHAGEQRYRPAYATAWDGDLLPEAHYRARLARDTEIEQRVHYPAIWGGSRGGVPVGAVELLNQDGRYDALLEYDLRDEPVQIWRFENGESEAIGIALCDSVSADDEQTLLIRTRGADARLDVRVDSDAIAFGGVRLLPLVQVPDAPLNYLVCNAPYVEMTVFDVGLAVEDWTRTPISTESRTVITRGVAIAGKQSAQVTVYDLGDDVTVDNPTLDTWSGGEPASWDVAVTGGGATVTDGGPGAVFATDGTDTAAISWDGLPLGNLIVIVGIANYTSGELRAAARGSTSDGTHEGTKFGLSGNGTFTAHVRALDAGTQTWLSLNASTNSDFEITSVSVYEAQSTGYLLDEFEEEVTSGYEAIRHLLTELGDFEESELPPADRYGLPANVNSVGAYRDDRPTLRAVLDDLMHGWLTDYYTDGNGDLVFVPLTPPEDGTPVSTLYERDLAGDLSVEDDRMASISDLGMWGRNYAPHGDGDLADGVADADREDFTEAYFTNRLKVIDPVFSLNPFAAFYAHGIGAKPWERLDRVEVDDEATPSATGDESLIRLHGVADTRRRFYSGEFFAPRVIGRKPGEVVTLNHSRYGLSAGKPLFIVSVRRTALRPTAQLLLWG